MAERHSTTARAGTLGSRLYEAIGGSAGCRRLSEAFYARVARDPVLRPLFPGKTFKCAIEAFSAYLAQFLGGPGEDTQLRWWLSLRESHQRFRIGQRERDAWIGDMVRALDDARVAEPMRGHLLGLFERSSAYLVNHGEATAPVEGNGEGRSDYMHREIVRRWDAQTALDQAVAAIGGGDAKGAIALAEGPALQRCDPWMVAGLLRVMIRSGQSEMLEYVRARLTGCPALAQERYAGRTLLHEAAAAGSLSMAELLLSLGAGPDAHTGGGHTPLYCVGNECSSEGGAQVVRVLARAGADVNAHDGVKHCTPLHMAARRGNARVAAALLDCGADIEARDSLGETPLRRAVNCGKVEVAALLLARGADRHSAGSKGMTPLLAARSAPMKRLLQGAAGGTAEKSPAPR